MSVATKTYLCDTGLPERATPVQAPRACWRSPRKLMANATPPGRVRRTQPRRHLRVVGQ